MKYHYTLFNPRVDRPLHEVTTKVAEVAYDGFIDDLNERLFQLRRLVATAGYGTPLDFSKESLETLHDFFYDFSKQDFEKKPEHPSPHFLSLCHDAGIYISSMLLTKNHNLYWTLSRIKGDITFHKPVIRGFNVKNEKYGKDFERNFCGYAYRLIKTGIKEEGYFLKLYSTAERLATQPLPDS